MENKDIMKEYWLIYNALKNSDNIGYMKLFGKVATEMFGYIASKDLEMAKDIILELEPVKWNNYLDKDEAEEIYEDMLPKPIWDYEATMKAVKSIGRETECTPYYNSYALWIAISMVYSDDAVTIGKIIGRDVNTIDTTTMIKACYALAIDKLMDEDGKFEIRAYFLH